MNIPYAIIALSLFLGISANINAAEKSPAFRGELLQAVTIIRTEKPERTFDIIPARVSEYLMIGDQARPFRFAVANLGQNSDLKGTIYRGGAPLPETYKFLQSRNVSAIFDLRYFHDKIAWYYNDIKNLTVKPYQQCSETTTQGPKCLFFPLGGVDPSWGGSFMFENKTFIKAYDTAVAELKAGRNIYLHCREGKDRTGALVTALVIRSYACGKDFNKAELNNSIQSTLTDFNFTEDKLPVLKHEMQDWVNYFQWHKTWICK